MSGRLAGIDMVEKEDLDLVSVWEMREGGREGDGGLDSVSVWGMREGGREVGD